MKGKMKALLAAALIMAAGGAYAWQPAEDVDTVEYRYTAEAGDTVWDLAARVARPEDDVRRLAWEIQRQNGLADARDLQPGQVLRVTVARAQ